jgi:hypothetical protein
MLGVLGVSYFGVVTFSNLQNGSMRPEGRLWLVTTLTLKSDIVISRVNECSYYKELTLNDEMSII